MMTERNSIRRAWTTLSADSVRKNVSAALCVRALQIIRFGVPLLEAWHRIPCLTRGGTC
jgi:hypothetical protein